MGQGIDNLDLEQVRYFNKSYDMNQLLKIIPILNSPEYYIENINEFPFYFEEFNIIEPEVASVNPLIEKSELVIETACPSASVAARAKDEEGVVPIAKSS